MHSQHEFLGGHRPRRRTGVLPVVATLACLGLAAACTSGDALPTAPTASTTAPMLPEAPIPTPGARIRIANTGDFTIWFMWLELPGENVRFGNVETNSITDYVATRHGAYEGTGFGYAMSDVLIGPFRPGREAPLPAPLAGYAFTYYVRLEFDWPYPPYVHTVRITRDE